MSVTFVISGSSDKVTLDRYSVEIYIYLQNKKDIALSSLELRKVTLSA